MAGLLIGELMHRVQRGQRRRHLRAGGKGPPQSDRNSGYQSLPLHPCITCKLTPVELALMEVSAAAPVSITFRQKKNELRLPKSDENTGLEDLHFRNLKTESTILNQFK
jgi:hypothetical protein